MKILATIFMLISMMGNNTLSAFMFNPFTVSEKAATMKKKDDTPKPIRGTIRNLDEDPLPGATVYLRSHGGTVNLASTTSDSNGEFTFGNYALGTYDIVVKYSTYDDKLVTSCVTGSHGIDIDIYIFN